jgi:hypothetical protein
MLWWAAGVAAWALLQQGCAGVTRQCKVEARVVMRPAEVRVYCDDTLAVSLSGPVTRDGH